MKILKECITNLNEGSIEGKFKGLLKKFKDIEPDAEVTFKQKSNGIIVYVNGQTAFNADDSGMYGDDNRLKAMGRAFKASTK